jgi:hypothetical protein
MRKRTVLDDLVHLVTQWDMKQESKRGHNKYALGIYLAACAAVDRDVKAGAPIDRAIREYFCDRLMDYILKNVERS